MPSQNSNALFFCHWKVSWVNTNVMIMFPKMNTEFLTKRIFCFPKINITINILDAYILVRDKTDVHPNNNIVLFLCKIFSKNTSFLKNPERNNRPLMEDNASITIIMLQWGTNTNRNRLSCKYMLLCITFPTEKNTILLKYACINRQNITKYIILVDMIKVKNLICLNVENATILLKSFSMQAMTLPILILTWLNATKTFLVLKCNVKTHFMKTKMPAVTRVVECTRAETGVGADIAAGNQHERGNCAPFVNAITDSTTKKNSTTRNTLNKIIANADPSCW